jgi:hypothetical protein
VSLHRAHLPGSTARNGLPPSRDYTYQGTGKDRGPNLSAEQLAPYQGGYEQWLPQFAHGARRARTGDACPGCGYKSGGRNCQVICGGAR